MADDQQQTQQQQQPTQQQSPPQTQLQNGTSGEKISPAVHNISFVGLTGAIFACITLGLFVYWEAFVSSSWYVKSNGTLTLNYGLWYTYQSAMGDEGKDWFLASQILFSSGLVGFVLSFVLSVIYMSANKASKNLTLTALVFAVFLTTLLTVIGLILIGSNVPTDCTISWSYVIAAIGLVLLFIGGLLGIRQIRKSNVRIC